MMPAFLARLKERTEKLVVGDVLDEATHVGPMIAPPHDPSAHFAKVMGYLDRAVAAGANVVCGGKQVKLEGALCGGYYVAPTVLDGVTDESEIVKEEVFGPVMCVLPFDTEEEAVRRANDTPYGLAAGVMTGSLARGHRIAKQFQAGTVWINNFNLCPVELPFGAYKMSGYGRECSLHAVDAFTQIKSVYVETGDVDTSCYPE